MLLHVVARGKIGRSPEAELVTRYAKRISWPLRLTELPETGGRVPEPRPVPREDLPPDALCGLDYFLVPALAPPAHGDNPDPDRPLTPAEILLATAIAEGWEPE